MVAILFTFANVLVGRDIEAWLRRRRIRSYENR